MPKSLALFPDTNFFLQCKNVHGLSWDRWSDFDEIQLIVAPPVSREIDAHKAGGNHRRSRRARETNSLFRKALFATDGRYIIQEEGPHVWLEVRPQCSPNPTLVHRLDYSERDDQLVGIVSQFVEDNPGVDARILTHDTHPIFAAQSVAVSAEPIPDDWLLDPEPTEAEKEVRRLRSKLEELKKMEPAFEVGLLESQSQTTGSLNFTLRRFEPLSDMETRKLVDRLQERFPIETDFGPRLAAERRTGIGKAIGIGQIYVPPTQNEINEYVTKDYPQWVEHCENLLSDLHKRVQTIEWAKQFSISLRNSGTRPAKDALVTITAAGSFELVPVQVRTKARELEQLERSDFMLIPMPPAAPIGYWKEASSGFGNLARLERSFRAEKDEEVILDFGVINIDPVNGEKDKNRFHPKSKMLNSPERELFFECEQWRHGSEEIHLECKIHFPCDAEEMKGKIQIRIQAENSSTVFQRDFDVWVTVQSQSMLEFANHQVQNLGKPRFQS